ncbi:MAG: hypothetical protein BWY66_00627 [bacterium ADurb.Bin374]|nr:MAG: hypothetical protein BWY66_00627 [bacterium ADurb.Bin374]
MEDHESWCAASRRDEFPVEQQGIRTFGKRRNHRQQACGAARSRNVSGGHAPRHQLRHHVGCHFSADRARIHLAGEFRHRFPAVLELAAETGHEEAFRKIELPVHLADVERHHRQMQFETPFVPQVADVLREEDRHAERGICLAGPRGADQGNVDLAVLAAAGLHRLAVHFQGQDLQPLWHRSEDEELVVVVAHDQVEARQGLAVWVHDGFCDGGVDLGRADLEIAVLRHAHRGGRVFLILERLGQEAARASGHGGG